MDYVDLSHKISQAMPVYPGTEGPRIDHPFTIESHGFAESKLTLFSHVGTHMDAPKHMMAQGIGLEAFPVEQFIGKGIVLDCSKLEGKVIGIEDVRILKGRMEELAFVLIYTGWAKRWGSDGYYETCPTLSVEAAEWLSQYPLKGIGIDAISIDTMETSTFPIHRIFMTKPMVIIENLRNLEYLIEGVFTLCALPLKFEDSDGAPIRAVAYKG